MLFGDDENGQGGGSYAGGWKDDMFHGKGVLVWHAGPKYKGDWSCGREHGSGMKTRTRDGTLFTGEWEMGVPKAGIKIWPNGDMFTGTFTEDGAGEGTLILESETRLFKGTLENGVFKEHSIGGISYTLGGASPQITEVAKMKAKINELEQKLGQQTKSFEHTLAHVQRGVWMKLIPDHRRCNCVMKKVVITLGNHIIKFPEPICTLCPLDKVVKMEIDKRFGLDESQQVLSFSSTVKDEKLSPLGTPLTQLPDDVLPEIKVTLTPVLTIIESELRSISSVGRGSYGTVEKCVHIPSGREVAVKTMHDEIASEFNISRFILEAEIVSGLRHPNILKCIGTCTTRSGRLQIVSELLCCSLRKLLTHRQLSFNEATAIALNVAKGMDSLHRQQYMHRDLSSNNILFDSNGIPKICDFGVSQNTGQIRSKEEMPRVPGTPTYMAPQMFTAHYSIEGDMWSFGVLLAEMLNGGIVSNTITPTQHRTFLQEQKRVLLPPDDNEVSRLCEEIGETTVAHCLSIRKASLEAVRHLTHYTYSPPQTAADFMCDIAQLCFSILGVFVPPPEQQPLI
ncbi:protein kinase [Pelomyxa schiedti]|nr:protein kinase [Pelomyxa schiedti]